MTAMRMLAVAAVGMLIAASAALAQDSPKVRPQRPAGGPEGVRPGDRPERLAERPGPKPPLLVEFSIDRLKEVLGLTDDQVAQIKQLQNTHKQAMENLKKGLGEGPAPLRQELKKAIEAKDEAAIKAAREKLAKAEQELRQLQEKLVADISALLTDEQKPKFRLFLERRDKVVSEARRIHAALAQLELTDVQRQSIRKIIADTEAAAVAAEGLPAKAKLWRKAIEDVKKILTAEQLKKFEAVGKNLQLAGVFAGLDLTEEQRTKVETIMGEVREKAKDASPEEQKKLMQQALRKIRAEVLTKEQAEKLDKLPRPGAERPRARGGAGIAPGPAQ